MSFLLVGRYQPVEAHPATAADREVICVIERGSIVCGNVVLEIVPGPGPVLRYHHIAMLQVQGCREGNATGGGYKRRRARIVDRQRIREETERKKRVHVVSARIPSRGKQSHALRGGFHKHLVFRIRDARGGEDLG